MTGLRQFGRQVAVNVGKPGTPGRRWTGLRIGFSIEKTDSAKPDKGKIQIYNLTESSRSLLEEDGAKVFLFAGYANADLIFSGDIDDVTISRDGRDIVAEIEAADGRTVYQSGQLFQTFGPPLDSTTLIRRIAAAMPIKIRTLPADLPSIPYLQGYTVAGPARDALDEITSSLDAKWSIQDGELVVTRNGQGTAETAFLVNSRTGLVGAPEKTKRGVKFSVLLNGAIRPRRVVKLESEKFNGFYLVKKATLVGDSGFDSTFYVDVEAQERK